MNSYAEAKGKRAEPEGQTFSQKRDGARLAKQHKSVLDLMIDGRWRTLARIAEAVGGKEASVSARLRDLRKPQFGGYRVEREHLGNGLWQYRVLKP